MYSGIVIFLTGLSGSGKSTIAELLSAEDFPITVLDGDIVRTHLSKGLGFSKEDRDINIRRIGFVAAEIARHGGFVICAAIAPYDKIRKEVRTMVEPYGRFILVHLSTSLEECEKRDVKGLYAKARNNEIENFTGITDPYEVPEDADLVIDTALETPEDSISKIWSLIKDQTT